MSSTDAFAIVDTTISVPAAAVARAVSMSPPSRRWPWWPTGATSTGIETSAPSTVVARLGAATPVSTRGSSRIRANASRLPISARSSTEPPTR